MKIVLDTNVLVAGLLSPFGPCARIVSMVSAGQLTLCVDARVTSEYAEVLRRPKFRFEEETVVSLLEYIEHDNPAVASTPLAHPLPDTDDEPFLEVALSVGTEYLITGNLAHFPSPLCQGVKVVSPADFLKHYKRRQGRKRA
jgi:uncharacterized protein